MPVDDRESTDSESAESDSAKFYAPNASAFSNSRGSSPGGSFRSGFTSDVDGTESTRRRSSSAPLMHMPPPGLLPPPMDNKWAPQSPLSSRFFEGNDDRESMSLSPPASIDPSHPSHGQQEFLQGHNSPDTVARSPLDSSMFRDSHSFGVAPRRGSFSSDGQPAVLELGIAQSARRGASDEARSPIVLNLDEQVQQEQQLAEGDALLSPNTTQSFMFLLQDERPASFEAMHQRQMQPQHTQPPSLFPQVAGGRMSSAFAPQQSPGGSWFPQGHAAHGGQDNDGYTPSHHSPGMCVDPFSMESLEMSLGDLHPTPPSHKATHGSPYQQGMNGRPYGQQMRPQLPPRSPQLQPQQYGTPTRHRSVSLPMNVGASHGMLHIDRSPPGHSLNEYHYGQTPQSPQTNYYKLADTQAASYDGPYFQVQFKRCHRSFVLSSAAPSNIKPGDFVIVEGDRGEDMGVVVAMAPRDSPMISSIFAACASTLGRVATMDPVNVDANAFKKILRVASMQERLQLSMKYQEELDLLEVARERAREIYCLPMTLVDAEYQFDRNKLILYYSASRRIDFREFVRDLFAMYKTRIWMEQATTHHSFRPSEAAARALASGLLQHSSITDASGQTVMAMGAEATDSPRRAMSQPVNPRAYSPQHMEMMGQHQQLQQQLQQQQQQQQLQQQQLQQQQLQQQLYGQGDLDRMNFNHSYPPRGPVQPNQPNQPYVAYGFSPHRNGQPSPGGMCSPGGMFPHGAPPMDQGLSLGQGFNNMLGLGVENHNEGSYLDSSR